MKFKILTLISLATISFASCSKDYLERPQIGTLTEAEAIKTEEDLQKLLNGGYINLTNNVYGGHIQFIQDLLGDQANGILYSEDFGEINKRKTSIFGGYKNDFYRNAYYIINQANVALGKLDIASAQKDNIEGQARFMRAMIHFDMVRLFAQPWGASADNSHLGIPLRLASTSEQLPRATVKEVYDAVIADLQIAENKLPDVAGTGLPSKWAAKALLAKVYFQQNNFAQAFNYADQVIKSSKFQLDASHVRRFSLPAIPILASREGIFVIKSVLNNLEPGGQLRDRYRSDIAFSPQSKFHVTDIVFNQATAPNDARAAWYTKNSAGYNMLNKYNLNRFDLPIIHYTEIVLIRAEAGAETGVAANVAQAITDINSILSRAYGGNSQNLGPTTPAGIVISTARTQRELELMGEGNRVQEIKRIGARNGTNIDRRGAPWNCNGLVLQFPNGEQAANTSFVMNPEGGCN